MRLNRKNFYSLKAFSFIEILFSLLIIGLLILPIFSLMEKSQKNSQEALDKMVANNILRSIEANILNRPYLWIKKKLAAQRIEKEIYFDPQTDFDPNSILISQNTEKKKVSHQKYKIIIEAKEIKNFIVVKLEIRWDNGKKFLKTGKIISNI